MLKSVLYFLLLLTTTVRFADIIYLLAKDNTNLPIAVIIVSAAMILYGIFLLMKKFVSIVRLKQLLAFYMVQTGLIVFNLIYVAVYCPLQISMAETVVMGTFLDILVNGGLIYLCMKQMRSFHLPAVQPMVVGKGHVNV